MEFPLHTGCWTALQRGVEPSIAVQKRPRDLLYDAACEGMFFTRVKSLYQTLYGRINVVLELDSEREREKALVHLRNPLQLLCDRHHFVSVGLCDSH